MEVRIVVHEPENWKDENIFGRIIFERNGNRIIVKMVKPIKGKSIESNLIELEPQNENETFKGLHQYYSVMVKGNLIDENKNISEYIISGSITFI